MPIYNPPPAGGGTGVTSHDQLTGVTSLQHHAETHIVSAAAHTFPGGASLFLAGTGAWLVPPAGGGITTHRINTPQNISVSAPVSITGLSFALASATNYAFKYHIVYRTNSSTVGWKFAVDMLPAGANLEYLMMWQTVANNTTGAMTMRKITTSVGPSTASFPDASTADQLVPIEGSIRVSATAGSLDVLGGAEVGGTSNFLTIMAGTWGYHF